MKDADFPPQASANAPMSSSQDSNECHKYKYKPLLGIIVNEHLNKLRHTAERIETSWHKEVELYEIKYSNLTMTRLSNSNSNSNNNSIRTNYSWIPPRVNLASKKWDCNMFPYHRSLYPLLDMYYTIEKQHEKEYLLDDANDIHSDNYNIVIPSYICDTIRRRQFNEEMEVAEDFERSELMTTSVSGYMPNSAYAIRKTLLPLNRAQAYQEMILKQQQQNDSGRGENGIVTDWRDLDSSGFGFLFEWQTEIISEEKNYGYDGYDIHDGFDKMVKYIQENRISKHRQRILQSIPFLVHRHGDSDDMRDSTSNMNITEITELLLKLLKHSMSNLQRDHRLARAILLLLIELKCFDDAHDCTDYENINSIKQEESLQWLLTTLASEFIHDCNLNCHQDFMDKYGEETNIDDFVDVDDNGEMIEFPSHYCEDWEEFSETVKLLFSHGIVYLSSAQSCTFSAFVIFQFECCGAREVDFDKDAQPTTSHDGEDEDLQLSLVLHAVRGVGLHACQDRDKIRMLLRLRLIHLDRYSNKDYENDSNESGSKVGDSTYSSITAELNRVIQSYLNCIQCLVYIGQSAILRLATDDQNAYLCSVLVRMLLEAYTDEPFHSFQSSSTNFGGTNLYVGYSINHTHTSTIFNKNDGNDYLSSRYWNLINPHRYSNAVADASNLSKLRWKDLQFLLFYNNARWCSTMERDPIVQQIFISPPPVDVQDLVRGLFVRQLVNTSFSGCGYGDFLTLWRLPITPFDPLLYQKHLHFPDEHDLQEDGGWGVDEEKNKLSGSLLDSRYDFNLLMLNQAYNAPWTSRSHDSFQKPFKKAVKTLALCAHRLHIPNEIAQMVNSFLSRNWWPDEKKQCWYNDCQLRSLLLLMKFKVHERGLFTGKEKEGRSVKSRSNEIGGNNKTKKQNTFVCGGCGIAAFCSKRHMKYVHYEGHRRVCGSPPFRVPSSEDKMFCRDVIEETVVRMDDGIQFLSGEISPYNVDCDISQDEEDDKSCWESTGSDKDVYCLPEKRTRTEMINNFFEKKAYTSQRITVPAFANFYQE